MRAGLFLALALVLPALVTGCSNSAEKEQESRIGSRPKRGSEYDYDSYSRTRTQRRLQDLEDQADAEQDRSGDEDIVVARPGRDSRTARRPQRGDRIDESSGAEDAEPEEAGLEDERSVGRNDRYEAEPVESISEDQSTSDILADDEEDPRRR
jgi:hypothetical protein